MTGVGGVDGHLLRVMSASTKLSDIYMGKHSEKSPSENELPIDVVAMGEIIGKILEENGEQFARDRIIETIRMNDDEMFVGDLLDEFAKINGYDAVAPTWYTLEKMQSEGLVMM